MSFIYTHTNHRSISNDIFAELQHSSILIRNPTEVKTIKVSASPIAQDEIIEPISAAFSSKNCKLFPSPSFLAEQIDEFVQAFVLPKARCCHGAVLTISLLDENNQCIMKLDQKFYTLLIRDVPDARFTGKINL